MVAWILVTWAKRSSHSWMIDSLIDWFHRSIRHHNLIERISLLSGRHQIGSQLIDWFRKFLDVVLEFEHIWGFKNFLGKPDNFKNSILSHERIQKKQPCSGCSSSRSCSLAARSWLVDWASTRHSLVRLSIRVSHSANGSWLVESAIDFSSVRRVRDSVISLFRLKLSYWCFTLKTVWIFTIYKKKFEMMFQNLLM